MNTHVPLARMMIALDRHRKWRRQGPAGDSHPVLVILDEFASLRKMEVIENAVAR